MEQVTYWKKKIEAASREKINELQLARFKERMQYVYERSPMYKKKYDKAGIKPSDIQTLDDIQYVPFTVKEDLRESQAKYPPWGDFFCVPPEESVRVFQTTGTSGKPVKIYLNKNDWTINLDEQFMHHMHGYGIKTSDILFVPFGYGIYIAWWVFQAAMERAGVTIVPGGAQSTKDRVRNIFEYNATVVCGTPTYLLYLAETAKEIGIPLTNSAVQILVSGGEPGANVNATKKVLEELWGAKCYDDIGSSEISTFGFECIAQKGVHVIESQFYPECLDPETLRPVGEGEVGELVLSNLYAETMPLLRFRIKDLVRFNKKTCECGRTFVRLDGGVLGRSDDMFQFAGVNIFPTAIENFVRDVAEFSNEYQLIVPKMGSGKHLKICVEPASPEVSKERMDQVTEQFKETIKRNITITPEVEIVETGKLPRFELKATRVIHENK